MPLSVGSENAMNILALQAPRWLQAALLEHGHWTLWLSDWLQRDYQKRTDDYKSNVCFLHAMTVFVIGSKMSANWKYDIMLFDLMVVVLIFLKWSKNTDIIDIYCNFWSIQEANWWVHR